MTVVAVIADTHLPRGSRRLPDACLLRLRKSDVVLHAGDFVALEFLRELEELGPPLYGVHGNMDEPALRELLPVQRVVEVGGVRIGMVHDAGPRAGREGRLAARFPGCAAVVYGHSHLPQAERHGDLWLLNPGSPTERRRAPARTMLVLTVERSAIRHELVTLSA